MPLEPIKHYSIESPVVTVHDEEAMTALQLSGRTVAKVNEAIGEFNRLEADTNHHLETQDNDIAVRLGNQDKAIAKMNNETMPANVTAEVQRRIDSGEFDHSIDTYVGNLETRVDNLLNSTPNAPTTMDAEIIDARTGVNGKVFNSLGDAMRSMSKYLIYDVKWSNPGYYITTGGSITQNASFCMSEPIPVYPGEIFTIECPVDNTYMKQVGFYRGSDLMDGWRIDGEFLYCGAGETTFTVPEEARYMYLSAQNGYLPKLSRWVKEHENILYSQLTSPKLDLIGASIDVEFDVNKYHYFTQSNTFFHNPNLEYHLSNPIPVTEGEILKVTVVYENAYTADIVFMDGPGLDYKVIKPHFTDKPGSYMVVVPVGATHMVVRNQYGGGIDFGPVVVQRTGVNCLDETKKIMPTLVSGSVEISLPEKFYAVVGETLELFYKGLVRAYNPECYDISVVCAIGQSYARKYVVTPTTQTMDNYPLTVVVRDNTGNILAQKTTILSVVNKLTSTTPTSVLCIGDSLTAAGVWTTELKSLLDKDGLSNVSFIGSKMSNNVKYEATGGWSIDSYLALNDNNPFWNAMTGQVDFATYVNTYGSGTLDVCVIFLGWNSTGTDMTEYKPKIVALMDAIRKDFPNVKFLLYGLQVPSRDGFGENYGCTWVYADKLKFVFNLNQALMEIAHDYTGARFVNISAQFDTDYCMPVESRPANKRTTTKENVQTNGVHPAPVGYYQIADVGYREMTALLQEA